MTSDNLPDDIRRFVLTSIPSVPYLEALLLLRSQPQQAWGAAAVARRLYVPEARAAELLRALQESELVAWTEGEGFRYAPRDEALRITIDTLDRLYATRLVEITSLIHTRVEKRAMQFADAFRWKKDN
ncbi:MAG TPA: hypothetical protein VGD76_10220 [Ramlibacter sp.]